MTKTFIVTGTDTGIGKTTAAAMLTAALDGCYWKPIQSGIEAETDKERVRHLAALSDERLLPEGYRLSEPLSPHRSAEIDVVRIDVDTLVLPQTDRPLIVEGAGGLLVPLSRLKLQIDIFARWGAPLILCARTGLGTINHTLLSIEALQARNMLLHGLIFIGEDNADNMQTIADFSGARILGHIPHLATLDHAALMRVFATRFRREDFA